MNNKSLYLAGGCFWGVQYLFNKEDGIIKTTVGYMGGTVANPSYQQVSTGKTNHLEVVKIDYNPTLISYESIIKFFFEIHDFSQEDGQGPDLGSQYLSAIFCNNKEEEVIANHVINNLKLLGYHVATKIYGVLPFYTAENYHQNYYDTQKSQPYCHFRKKIMWQNP